MTQVLLKTSFCFLFLWNLCAASSEQVEGPSPHESVRLRSLQEQKINSSQHQNYPSQKLVEIKDRSSQQCSLSHISSMPYPARSFFGITNALIGRKIVTGSEDSSFSTQRAGFAQMAFPIHRYSTERCYLSKKKDTKIADQIFSTHEVQLAPKAQGAVDHDPSLQQLSKKNFRPDEVRALLDKRI